MTVEVIYTEDSRNRPRSNHILYFSPDHPYPEFWTNLQDWAMNNCKEDVVVVVHDCNGYWVDDWEFQSEDDMMLFKLRWGGTLPDSD